VSWNKPFKERIRYYYKLWMTNEDRREWTDKGNPKAPALEVVLEWVDRAWQEISNEIIVRSFKGRPFRVGSTNCNFYHSACALTTATDGSEDDKITCFKPDGPIGTSGVDILREARAQEMARDGRHDYQDQDEEESEPEANLENVNDMDPLFFD
jgi:hypothetical protein